MDKFLKKDFNPASNLITKDPDYEADITVYTDGTCSNNGQPNAKSGIGVFFGKNDPRNISRPLEIYLNQTNNVAELQAIIVAYKSLKEEISEDNQKTLLICSDSQVAVGWATVTGEKYAFANWKKKGGPIPNLNLIKEAYEMFKDLQNVKFLKVEAHTNGTDKHSIGNDGADKLANQAIGLRNCPYMANSNVNINECFDFEEEYQSQSQKYDEPRKIYLKVPYEDKEDAKLLGSRWDKEAKKWYINADHENLDELLCKFGKESEEKESNSIKIYNFTCDDETEQKHEKIYLKVAYKDKDDAKSLGAKWDSSQKKWYIFDDHENLDELVSKFGVN